MRKIGAALVIFIVALLGAAAFLLLRPPAQVASSVDADVTIVCHATTSVSGDACRDWGDDVLALGPPSTTFEMVDLARLVFTKPMLGLGSPCQVEYFLQRYPEDPAWDSDTPCRGS